MSEQVTDEIRKQLAPTGVLRVGVNLSNFLLVTGHRDNGEPEGVSPDMGRAIATRLGVTPTFVEFEGPGQLADAATEDVWDIGNIAAESERARTIRFSPPYCEIQATYLLGPWSELERMSAVDAEGVRIVVKERSAYDLWLTENLLKAEIIRQPSVDAALACFVENQHPVLAGLRPKLIEQQQTVPGSRVLDGSFTAVQQCVGCPQGRPAAAHFLERFVQQAIDSGEVQSMIERHGVSGRLSVANSTNTERDTGR